ncbi:acetolactate synthase AlsS [[Acholeplasma] multilocale]|uniref:acetolactate synthase AlsS n=1 Tax=[Acholeplasma] multilocale TaxID=264638 RepID=UPI000684A34B|nr:acetolactate synthase AlsS [[Acholeplasma] multilocale]
MKKITGAKLLVDTLINHDVKYVFTVPGAKIDKILDEFNNNDKAPELILSRHEQNAAFMAQGIGRITGEPGVVLVTSGPGVSNLATGLVTATSESDPVLAIGGNVKRKDSLKRTHQSMNNVAMMAPITKYSKEVLSADSIAEAVSNAYREAVSSRKGATFLSIPQDVSFELTEYTALSPNSIETMGRAPKAKIFKLIEAIQNSKRPVLLLGMRAPQATEAIRTFLTKFAMPVVATFQATGTISHDLEKRFMGRVGLFKNQPGDILLDESDLIISIGFDPIEYDPEIWNKDLNRDIYHIDEHISDIDNNYQATAELMGDITKTINKLTELLSLTDWMVSEDYLSHIEKLKTKFTDINKMFKINPDLTHPLQLMQEVRSLIDNPEFDVIDDETVITVDVGSLYIWMARNFKVYQPKKLLFSNGMQTLGVALPWAISASLLNPDKKVLSMSGDGGFLFSGQELDTAVRTKSNITHIIWNDSSYDMVDFQQKNKYGRSTATKLGDVDFAKYAESFGAKGFKVEHPSQLKDVLKEAISYQGVAIVDVPIDYSGNIILGEMMVKEID